MKIAIFGGTGSVGVHAVEQALEAGHQVTLLARNPAKVEREHPNLRVIQGDVLRDDDRIVEAVVGQDAVVVILGSGLAGRVRAEGTRRIVAAMRNAGIERLVCQSTLGAGDSFASLNTKWRWIFRIPLRQALRDHERQEAIVRDSGLDWTIVRPSAFTDESTDTPPRLGFRGRLRDLSLTVSRAEVAACLLSIAASQRYRSATLSLSS